jgi:lipid II:glycine glycyltransferase (peptidoglycan interpeptide bridge formation enzyme)
MARTHKHISMIYNPDLDAASSAAVKFDLYVKNRELQQIAQSFRSIMLLPPKQRKKWTEQYQDLIEDLMDSFTDDSLLAMDGIQLDDESMDLSTELVSNLKTTMNIIQDMLAETKTARST